MKYILSALLALTFLLGGCATSVMTSGGIVVEDDDTQVGIRISSRDREQIRLYYSRSYSKQHKKTPPGLAKRGGSLPPGLAKRDVLPKGLQERGLPADLERRLSRLPEGYVRVIVGTDIVLMNSRSRVIIDIYRNFDTN